MRTERLPSRNGRSPSKILPKKIIVVLPDEQTIKIGNPVLAKCIELAISRSREENPLVRRSELLELHNTDRQSDDQNKLDHMVSQTLYSAKSVLGRHGFTITPVTKGRRWNPDEEASYLFSKLELEQPPQETLPPQQASVFDFQALRQRMAGNTKNQSPEERAQQKAEEVQRIKGLVPIILTRELVLPSQDYKRIDLLGLIKIVNPNQDVAVEEIIEGNSLQAAKRFAVTAVDTTIRKWWNTANIQDLEPIERKPAEKVLEFKTQGLDVQEVLSKIFNRFPSTSSLEPVSPK